MSNQLTAEQQRKIEENRRKALERRAQRLGETISSSKQTSVGFNITSLQAQPPKQSVNSDPATFSHHKETPNSASAAKRSVPPFQQESQRLSNTVNQINQSTDSVSSRKVRSYAVMSFRGK